MDLSKFGKVCYVLESKNPHPACVIDIKRMCTCKEKYVG